MTVRVRYGGRTEEEVWVQKMSGGYWRTIRGCPKNTLVTIRDGNRIFFGVARYNARYGYPFTKKMGRKIAQGRAESMRKLMGGNPLPDTAAGIIYAESGLAGCCNVDSILLVLNYFNAIEELAPEGKLLYDMGEGMQVLAGVEKAENFAPGPPLPDAMVKEKTISISPERVQHLAGV